MIPPFFRGLLRALAWIILALGVAAGLLYLQAVGGPSYQPVAQAALGLGCLAIGYLLGHALRSLGHRRAPVPISVDAPLPPIEATGRLWARGFAAGFWALFGLSIAATLLYEFAAWLPGIILPGQTQAFLMLLGLVLCAAIPLAIARGTLLGLVGLSRWSTTAASIAACAGGWALVVALWLLLFLLQDPGPADLFSLLLTLTGLPFVLAGTMVLARSLWPDRYRASWAIPLALAPLIAAWLIYGRVNAWLSSFGPFLAVAWLLPLGLLWGGSLGALSAVSVAQRRRRAPGERPRARRPHVLALTVVGFCLLLLLLPLWAWQTFNAIPSTPASTVPTPALPDARQPGVVPLPGPAPLSPKQGAVVTGSLWTFRWTPPRGAPSSQLYQFALWPPGAPTPITQFITPTPQAQVQTAPETLSRHPGTWTWRVRLIHPTQGAGQWSPSRSFTTVVK